MKTLLLYVRSRFWMLLAFGLGTGVFALVVHLNNLPLEAVGYAALLSGCVLLAFGVADFIRFAVYMRRLQHLSADTPGWTDALPQTFDPVQARYHTLLCAQAEAQAALVLQYERAALDMTDYYTLWTHQIKTPIAALRLLLPSDSDAAQQELFKIEQYTDLTLTYLRLFADNNDFVFKPTDIDTVIKAAVRKYARLFILKKLPLQYEETHVTVVTDEKWLGFIIEQLLSNALKYTRQGGIAIRLEEDALHIADTGIGIAPEDLPRIFEKGYTGYNGRGEQKSTGIGLYLAKRAADKLKHSLSVQSTMGVGTTVSIGLYRPNVTDV